MLAHSPKKHKVLPVSYLGIAPANSTSLKDARVAYSLPPVNWYLRGKWAQTLCWGQQHCVSAGVWPVRHFRCCPSCCAFTPWPGVFRGDIFFQVELTPFVTSHLFVLVLIIRAVRGWGARLASPLSGKLNSPASGRVSSAKGEIAKKWKKKVEEKGQQPLGGLCLSQGQNVTPHSSWYREGI